MKYKVLLVGEAENIIRKFFSEGNSLFECCTSSLIAGDFDNNMRYFQPDVVAYCMNEEHWEHMRKVSEVAEVPLIIIASQPEYNSYVAFTRKKAEIFVQASETFDVILDALSAFMSELSGEHEAMTLHQAAQLVSTAESGGQGGKRRIMLIDDSTVMQRAIISMLKTEYNVVTAISGQAALHYLENKTVDLILLDYELADENGASVFRALSANPRTSSIPIVFLTGVSDSGKIREILSLKPKGYLLKPVEKIMLVDKIQDALRFVPC